jgi:RNA polymerase sigma-70 factor (ECF subfamily)
MADPELLTHWLHATARGDRQAFQALYRAASPHLFSVLLRMLRRRDVAEDALQDCFVRIWQNASSYAPDRGAPMTWMMSIARYRALDLIRRQRPEVSLDDEDPEADPEDDHNETERGPVASSMTQEGMEVLKECLDTLQDVQRESVLLAYYEGYTHHELAARLGKPLGTVKSWVRRGLQRLRECLDS